MNGAQSKGAAHAHEDAGFLRTVLQAVPAFVVLVDPELRIVYINRLQPGFELEHVIGRSVEEFTAPEYHQRQRDAIASALGTGEAQPFIMQGPAADGSVTYYESRAVPVDYGAGKRAVCIIAVDVTEHVARSEALRQSEERLRLLVDATGMGLWSWDPINDIVEWNPGMHAITGMATPLPPSEYLERLTHPDDRLIVAARMDQIEELDVDQRTHRIVRPDGSTRWVLPCGRSTRDEHGTIVRIMGGLLDVTAQHLTEQHLRDAQKIDAVGALTAGVAHNFNNMLAVIVPTLDFLVGEVQESRKQLARDAAHAARRAAELVAQLMTFAGQRGASERTPQELKPIVEQAISMCAGTFAAQIAIDFSVQPCGSVRCDAAAIEQVVVNLLINARDSVVLAGKEGSQVRVELREVTATAPGEANAPPARFARIAVRDEGVGMTHKVKDRLFEPFFTTKEPGKGTGLGLATSYGIVRDHEGFIAVTTGPNEGATFAVHLPVESTKQAPSELAAQLANGKPGTVLVVDDEAAVLAVVAQALGMGGHRALTASDARSLASALGEQPAPDLVLLDRSMPSLPVKVALAEIRKHAPSAPVLFFTGQEVPPSDRELVEGVLYKPLSLDELLAEANRWINRAFSTR